MIDRVEHALASARRALEASASGMSERLDDCIRIARLSVLAGIASSDVVGLIESRQQDDGGWIDVDETLWCVTALPERSSARERGLQWLGRERHPSGGWGRSARDASRIPSTSLVLRLQPRIGSPEDWQMLEDSWARDMSSDLKLTYKAAMYLMCQPGNPKRNRDLERQTLSFLSANVNPDGGFGPWRNHPIGSDAWSSGFCLVGLAAIAPKNPMLDSVAAWLCSSQLETGYWPYHYLDEGAAYAFWGLSEALRVRSAA